MSASGRWVLVVDDERGLRDMLASALGRGGYNVACAPEGAKALELARQRRFDAAVCDLSMPGMNGIEVTRRLREIQPGLPVIIATGYPTQESEQEAMKLGAFAYLAKPFNLSDIEAIVERACMQPRPGETP